MNYKNTIAIISDNNRLVVLVAKDMHTMILEKFCFRSKKNIWHVESNYILQPPKYLIIVVNQLRYIKNNFTKDRCSIPLDMTVAFGLHKFSMQATIDHHGPFMYSGNYAASINSCKKKHSIPTTAKLRSLKGLIPKTLLLLMWQRINRLQNGFRTRIGWWEFSATFRHCNTHTHTHSRKITTMRNWSWEMIMGFEALYAGRGRSNPVWSGKEAHWSLRELIVKSAEYCGADYKPSDRYLAIAVVLKWDCKMGLHRICIYPTIMFPRANVLSKQCGHGIWQLLNGTIYLSL